MERKQLIGYRHKKHLTLEQVAEALEVDVATLQRWEKGKASPRGYNLERLCAFYETSAVELELEEDVLFDDDPGKQHVPSNTFATSDLTMRLLALGFIPHQDFQDVQNSLRQIIGEFDAMNPENKTTLITRREALCRLATLPMITMAASAAPRSPDDAINQCAVGTAACWELSRSRDEEDITLAFEGVTAYLPVLKSIMENASKLRKAAAALAAQCSLLQTVLGWHFTGLKSATQAGLDAVNYSKQAEDISLQLSAYKCLSWSYYYGHHDKKAVQTIEQAVSLLNQHKASLPPYIHSNIYSTQAVMRAKSGLSSIETLQNAEKTALYDEEYPIYVDPPVAAFIRNAGMALYQACDYGQAMTTFQQIVHPETFAARRSLPERTRMEVLNVMTLASLKNENKDMDKTLHIWDAAMIGARHLQSEQRFIEARSAFDIMEAVWPHEKQIAERRELAMHW